MIGPMSVVVLLLFFSELVIFVIVISIRLVVPLVLPEKHLIFVNKVVVFGAALAPHVRVTAALVRLLLG